MGGDVQQEAHGRDCGAVVVELPLPRSTPSQANAPAGQGATHDTAAPCACPPTRVSRSKGALNLQAQRPRSLPTCISAQPPP